LSASQHACVPVAVPAGVASLRQLIQPALLTLAALVAMLVTFPATAQTTRRTGHETNANRQARIAREVADTYSHRWEFGGGGGFLRFSAGQYLQKDPEVSFWFNSTYFLTQKLGITGELRGSYGNAKLYNNATQYGITYRPQISEYPYMGGVTYRVYMRERYGVSAFALAGAAIGKFDGDLKTLPSPLVGMWPTANARPAFSTGANVDLNLYPNLVFRIAPSYSPTMFGNSFENNLGVNLGVVVRLGRQK
jgi:hypothetical protein